MESVISFRPNVAALREPPVIELAVSWTLILPVLYYASHGIFWFQVSATNNSLGASYGQVVGGGRTSVDLVVQMTIFVIVSVLLLTRLKAVVGLCLKQKLFVLIPLLAVASTSWSQDPSSTLKNSVYLGINVLFAFYLYERFGPQRLLQILLVVGTVSLVLSIALSVFIPGYGVDNAVGNNAWRGIYNTKNACAAMTTFFLAGAFYAPSLTLLGRLWRRVYVCLSLVLIFMSKSATSDILVVLLLIYVVTVKLTQRLRASDRAMATVLAILLMGAMVVSAIPSLSQILDAFGKSSTLTGRTSIWHSAMAAVFKRPLLGYGYMAFWQPFSGRVNSVFLENRWSVSGAHNGFLEVWLSLGAIGLALVLFTFVRAIRDAANCLLLGSSPSLNWFASLIFLALVLNIDESHLMVSNDLMSMLYVIACVGLAVGAARLRGGSVSA
jgi:exopolysaccharide production protein ExoQ